MRRSLTLCSLTSSSAGKGHLSMKKKERQGVSPSEYVIRNILNYSKALSVLSTKESGYVSVVMN